VLFDGWQHLAAHRGQQRLVRPVRLGDQMVQRLMCRLNPLGLNLRKSPYQQRFPLRRCRSALRAVVGLDGTASACVTLIDLVDQRLLALRLAR
jgi:hypothetical protein